MCNSCLYVSLAESCFCDGSLRTRGFDREGIQSSSVVTIKSHSFTPFWTTELGKLELGVKVRVKLDRIKGQD